MIAGLNMDEIIRWLIGLERKAFNLYVDASTFFGEDRDLAKFLHHLARDEAWHVHIMESAAEYVRNNERIGAGITIDQETRDSIEKPYISCRNLLDAGSITKESMIDCVINSEYSEWNSLFLYIINTLKNKSREFMYAAALIQNHIKKIEQFLSATAEDDETINKLRGLPQVWQKKILIVEDDEAISELLRAILKRYGAVYAAMNGDEGLEKTSQGYYDVIISDIEMPFMGGIDFFRRTVEIYPESKKNFIFFSGNPANEHIEFINKNGLYFLSKPATIAEIKRAVDTILTNPPTNAGVKP